MTDALILDVTSARNLRGRQAATPGAMNIGSTSTKAEVMADVRRGVFRYSRMEHSEQRIRMYRTTAIVVGHTRNEGRRGNRDVSGDLRYTRIYVKRNDRWQAVLSQCTRIAGTGV